MNDEELAREIAQLLRKEHRQLRVYTTGAFALTQNVLIFDDWYSFADYVKQQNLQGRSVTIVNWEYF